MTDSSPWEWFHALAKEHVAPTAAKFGYTRLEPFGYPRDENWEWSGGMFFWHEVPSLRYIIVDILQYADYGPFPERKATPYFLIRSDVPSKSQGLKEFLYPQIRQQTKDNDLWVGWKCYTHDEVRDVLIEIAAGLNTYFTQHPPSP